jgi:hypothetical protein
VGQIDKFKNDVDQGITQCYNRINTAERNDVNQLLQKHRGFYQKKITKGKERDELVHDNSGISLASSVFIPKAGIMLLIISRNRKVLRDQFECKIACTCV